jgi:exodeoxyribonuclease V alpha subunit
VKSKRSITACGPSGAFSRHQFSADYTFDFRQGQVVRAAFRGCGAVAIAGAVPPAMPRPFGCDPMRDIQVLCPMHRGGLGARSLNIELQRTLNPRGEPKVEKFGTTFAIGDKVMQIENDYDKEVYNGDIGYVEAIDLELGEMTIAFDGRPVAYAFGEIDQIVLAYATTIHKSQGSEFPAVVIPVTTQHYMMLQRNLLYTGVTRGKRLVILLGQKKAVAIAVKNVSGRRRWSKLREWLKPAGLSIPRLIGA